ncbi:MAG: adenylate/guanylate cyclase domain-containing protein [Sphingomicrobium sp.]
MATSNRHGQSRRFAYLPGIAAILLVALLSVVPLPIIGPAMERAGLLTFDAYQRMAPRRYEEAPVRVVDIDEETIRRFGQWPWPRTDIARLTQALGTAGASAIAYDIVFSEADRTSPPRLAQRLALDPATRAMLARLPDNDALLAAAFAQAPVVDGFFLTHDEGHRTIEPKAGFAVAGTPPTRLTRFSDVIAPLPALELAATGNGFVSIAGDSDAIIRKAPLLARNGDTILPSLSLDALRVAQGAGSVVIKTSDSSGEFGGAGDVVSVKVGQFEVPTTPAGELWMHYTVPVPARVVPAWKILDGSLPPEEMAKLFGGQIVFVGAGAIGLRDLVSTPVQDRELGVMIHAQAAEQMILGHFLVRPDWAKGLELVLLLVVGTGLVLALPRIGAVRGAVVGALAMASFVGGSWYAFSARHFLLDPAWPMLGVAAGYLVSTVLTFWREERQRAYIHHAFDRYLSPELVKRIADDPSRLELGGEERDMSVLFCDIRSFSRISERMTPNQTISFLVRFLTPMTDLLLAHKATIDKYIGDAVLAFWNAPLDDPDHHQNAARAGLAMQARLTTLNAEMEARGDGSWPGKVKVGVGLNSGPCCVGNIGSEKRLSYSLIGDSVNLASRLEGMTKYYGVGIIMGSDLQRNLPGFASVMIDRMRVVGRAAPETIHAMLGDETLAGDEQFQAFARDHQAMLDAYHERQWDEAARLAEANEVAASEFGLTTLLMLYRDRIAAFIANPPSPEWDGVFEATKK